ncbi:uncharacterized protein LOC136080371 [Hydra vulgaris]|uniref:Uncharacterized protein LOC136080371 n=1 Tax=Hydra vulgaris TaxID=6087 RepID=A0ABM4BV33_HYDVU
MTYLRNLVQGQALSAITALSLSNDSYIIALDILKDRFSNKQILISSHMKKLLSLERVVNINNVNSLRRILDVIEIQVCSLENLGISSSMYGPLLIPVLLEKIPDDFNFITSRKLSENETWEIKNVLDVLKYELRAREQSNNSSEPSTLPFTASTFHSMGASNIMYKVELPFKLDHTVLGDNYNLSKSRFLALEKKFMKDSNLFTPYNGIIKNQLTKGIIERVFNFDSNIGDVHYLPHQTIICDDKQTSRVRVVFDASSSVSGPSLNNCLFSGPSLVTFIFGVLLRFRSKRIAFIVDIE